MLLPPSFLVGLGLASLATAHSHIAYININGLKYEGYDPRTNQPNFPNRVAWSHNATDDGWINFTDYLTPNMACHRDAKSVAAHAVVRPGDNIAVSWAGWPMNHPGPVFSYLAPCEGARDGCASVDKSKLQWTKIDDSAPVLISPDGPSPGTWATNVLIGNNNTWQVHVPAGLKPGPYVLRHEIIALLFASQPDLSGAQHYPVCINLLVIPRTPVPGPPPLPFSLKGVPATKLYERNHPGLVIDVNKPLSTYVVPGPTVAANAQPVPQAGQTQSVYAGDGRPVRVVGTGTVPFLAKRTGVEFEG